MDIGGFDVKEWDKRINQYPLIWEPMECVAHVAVMRLDNMGGVAPEAKQGAAESILAAARSGLLRVKGMAHPENGKLVHEWRDLDDIATPLRVKGWQGTATEQEAPAGLDARTGQDGKDERKSIEMDAADKGLVVPDVYVLHPEAMDLDPWEPALKRRGVDFRDHFCVTQMSYDDAGRIVGKTEMLDTPIHWKYGHDEAGRLQSVIRNGQTVERYAYDAKGRRSRGMSMWRPGFQRRGERACAYRNGNRLFEVGDTRCIYDENGSLSVKWPGLGEESPLALEHDKGAITGITLPDGRKIEYVYDEYGCRKERRVDGELHLQYGWLDLVRPAWVRDVRRGVAVRFAYGMDKNGTPLREALFMDVYRDGTGSGLPWEGTPQNGTTEPVRYALIVDQLGSLRGVRDEAGQMVKTFEYDSFGNLTFETGGNMFVPIGFAGGLTDPDHSFIHFGYRDPKVGPGTTRTWVAGQP